MKQLEMGKNARKRRKKTRFFMKNLFGVTKAKQKHKTKHKIKIK